MIDEKLRSRGVGASEVACLVGCDDRKDAFSLYVEKAGLAPRDPSVATPRMLAGKRFEEPIAAWYSEVSGLPVQWWDRTLVHPSRPWQVFSADAFVLKEQRCEIEVYGDIAGWAIGGADSKLVSWDQAADWGESGTDEVPDRVALQAQYSCSAANLPWWDVAAAFSLTELRIYRIHRDPEIEAMLLEAVEDFWVNHVLARVPPRPGASDATASALKRMFPRSTEPLRCATDAEWPLIESLRAAKQEAARAKRVLDEAKAQVIYAIGDSEGLLAGADRITYRRSKDSVGVKWEAVARELGLRLELVKPLVERALLDEAIRRSDSGRALVKADSGPLVGSMPGWWKDPWEAVVKEHTGVVKEGSRRLLTPRDWAGED